MKVRSNGCAYLGIKYRLLYLIAQAKSLLPHVVSLADVPEDALLQALR